jgi:hypothetical protein
MEPRNPYAKALDAPVRSRSLGVRIERHRDDGAAQPVIIDGEQFPQVTVLAAGAAAVRLAGAWWPRLSSTARDDLAVYLAHTYPHELARLYGAVKGDPPLPWRILKPLRSASWPLDGAGQPSRALARARGARYFLNPMPRLVRAINAALPDRRLVGGNKSGDYRRSVLLRADEILNALYGVRLPFRSYTSKIQKAPADKSRRRSS